MIILLHIVCIVRITVTSTSTNGSAVSLSCVFVCITWPVYCTAIGGSSGDLFNTATHLQNQISIRFGIILTQFYINFSRQEHQIDVLYVSFNAWDYQVSSYTPLHFSITVPLKNVLCKLWFSPNLTLNSSRVYIFR